MKRSLTIITIIAITLILGFTLVHNTMIPVKLSNIAKQPVKSHNLKKALKLTKAQSDKAKSISAESRSKIKPIISQLRTEKLKYNEMLKEHASVQALRQQKEIIANLMKQAKEIHRENLANFEQILTPEQSAHFQAIKIKNTIKVKLQPKQIISNEEIKVPQSDIAPKKEVILSNQTVDTTVK